MELKKYNFFTVYSIGMQIFLGTNNVVKYRNANYWTHWQTLLQH